jgi:phosphoribosylpyrophosphate synthetase
VRIVYFDIHATQESHYFTDDVVAPGKTAMSLLKAELNRLPEPPAIAFPDDGAWKRFREYLAGYDHIICNKVRSGDRRIITIKDGDPRGRIVVEVDDLVLSGGTLIECAEALAAAGAKEVNAYVTHGVFPEGSWQRFIKDKLFTRFWMTDSCPTVMNQLNGQGPFTVLPLAPLVSSIIHGGALCA